jgi:hypothetical protein
MPLRRLSLLLLAVFFITPDSWAVRSSRCPLTSPSNHEAGVLGQPAILPVSSPRPFSISPFSTWRYRLKSVIEETDTRIIREADLGPVPLPEPAFSSAAQTPRFDPFRTIVPLRC